MRIKQRPEDFSVIESYRFDRVPSGRFRVYLMDKQKLSTFDAIDRLREKFDLPVGAISYCGLKDKQGRTEQIIAVDGADIDMQEEDLRLKYLGRTDKPLTAANTTSNRFSVTVRALTEDDLSQLNVAAAEVARLGVINYFDSQRFGSLKHGQGFIAKDLIRGDFEAALRNYMAKPSPLDRSEDAKVKQFFKENWGDWKTRVPFNAAKKYQRILIALKKDPKDFVKAFLQIDASHRAMLLFTYQSYLWNEGVRRYLQLTLPREHLFPLPYQAGTLLFHRDAEPQTLRTLRDLTFPLLAPGMPAPQGQVKEAIDWVLGKEKLALSDLRIEEASSMLIYPHKLVLGRVEKDALNKPHSKLNVAFTLPPGAYATLVIKRLFHFSYRDDTSEEIRATGRRIDQPAEEKAPAPPERTPPRRRERPSKRPAAESTTPMGFRERQRLKKSKKAEARTRQKRSPRD